MGLPIDRRPLAVGTRVVRCIEMIEAEVDGKVVGYGAEAGAFFGFNTVGSRVWRLLQQPREVHEICSTLMQEYHVAPDVCRTQVLELLDSLRAAGLIATVDAPPDPDAM